MPEWLVDGDRTIDLEEPPRELEVAIVAGQLEVRGGEGAGVLSLSQVEGDPVEVSLVEGRLRVRQQQRSHGLGLGHRSSVQLALTVPPGCRCRLATVSAPVLATGLVAALDVETVSGEVSLDQLSGEVFAATVSGALVGRRLAESFAGKTVSGDLSLEGFRGSEGRVGTVSGDVVLDLEQAPGDARMDVSTTSGEVLLRLPTEPSQQVRVSSVSGRLVSGFPELSAERGPGRRQLRGSLGGGAGRLQVRTVSGAVSLLQGSAH